MATRRYLVIRRRSLSDVVLLGSVLRNLRLHDSKAKITFLTQHNYAPMAFLHPEVDQVSTFPRHLISWLGFFKTLRKQRFTHVLDFDNTRASALLARSLRATVCAASSCGKPRVRHRWAYTDTQVIHPEAFQVRHITETFLDLLATVGVPVETRENTLMPSEADKATVRPLIHRLDSTVLLHPGGWNRHLLWPEDRLAALCDRIQDELDARVFLVGGPMDRARIQTIREAAESHLVVIDRQFSFGEFAALAKLAALFICHEGWPMHIAAGGGTDVVALFGSQNATVHRPLGERHHVLQTTLPCSCLPAPPTPCVKADPERSHCVRKITVDEVFEAVRHSFGAQN